MKLGKIKSFGTYHRCIKELHLAGFIVYSPSYDAYKGSLVEIIDFDNPEIFQIQHFASKNYRYKRKITFVYRNSVR
jgi:hypothetical protein